MVDPFVFNLISGGQIIKRKIKELKGDLDQTSKEIMSHMKDSSMIINQAGEKLVTWSNSSRASLDQKLLEKTHPNLYEQFKQVATFRTFKIKDK